MAKVRLLAISYFNCITAYLTESRQVIGENQGFKPYPIKSQGVSEPDPIRVLLPATLWTCSIACFSSLPGTFGWLLLFFSFWHRSLVSKFLLSVRIPIHFYTILHQTKNESRHNHLWG